MTTPPWLSREIAAGLQALLALGLARAPSADAINMTLDVWLAVLVPRLGAAEPASGAARVRAAFRQLAEIRRQWPTPADFMEALPSPVPPALPAPRLTPEELARNRQRLAELIDRIFRTKQMNGE